MAKIVWIEDDFKKISQLQSLLEKKGHGVQPYDSWKEVLNDLQNICTSDLIILDILLEPFDEDDPYKGLTILRELRKVDGCKAKPPVIVFSRVRNQEVISQLEELGAAKTFRKPVKLSELFAAIEDILKGEETFDEPPKSD